MEFPRYTHDRLKTDYRLLRLIVDGLEKKSAAESGKLWFPESYIDSKLLSPK